MYEFNEEQKENILRIYPSVEEYILIDIRRKREKECFEIVNRGEIWYKKLKKEQKEELEVWYDKWLNATETKTIPKKPDWLI